MTEEKFIYDSKTALKFIQCYCDNEHKNQHKNDNSIILNYHDIDLGEELHYSMCKECEETFLYSYTKLQKCPHNEKPSCRKCSKPCYDKVEWKLLAKIMRYSGLKLGLLKVKQKILRKFKKII